MEEEEILYNPQSEQDVQLTTGGQEIDPPVNGSTSNGFLPKTNVFSKTNVPKAESSKQDERAQAILKFGQKFATNQYESGAERNLGIKLEDYQDILGSNIGYIPNKATLDSTRAERQSNWNQFGNAVSRIGLNIVPEILSQAGNALDLEDYYNADMEVGNFLSKKMEELKASTNEDFPIYRENPDKPLDYGDAAYWFDNGANIITSAGAFVALGAATGAGSLAGLTKGAKALQWLRGGEEAAAAISSANNTIRGLSTLASATMLNSAESIGIGANVYDQVYKNKLDELRSDESTMNLPYEQLDAMAKQDAANRASQAVNFNRMNILLNISSAGMLLRPNVGSTRNILSKGGLSNLGKVTTVEGAQEYAEETINDIGEQRALADTYTFKDALERVGSAEGIESGFLGFLGGAGQTALTKAGKYLPTHKNEEYINNYTSKYQELTKDTTLSSEQRDAQAKTYAIENSASSKKKISANELSNNAYIKQQAALERQKELVGVDNLTDTISILKNTEDTIKLQEEIQKAKESGDMNKVSTLENSLLETQALNAFTTGTTDNLESIYKAVREMPQDEAEERGIYNEGEEGTDLYYKTRMTKALDKIKVLEKEYIKSQSYINSNEIYNNRQNTLNIKEGLEETTKQFSDILTSATTSLPLTEKGTIPLITPYNITDINVLNNDFSSTQDYKNLKDLSNIIKTYTDTLEQLDNQYKTFITSDYQNELRKRIDALEEEKRKKVKKEAFNKQTSDNKKQNKGFLSNLKNKAVQNDTIVEPVTEINTSEVSSPERRTVEEQLPTATTEPTPQPTAEVTPIATNFSPIGIPEIDSNLASVNTFMSNPKVSLEQKKAGAEKMLANADKLSMVNPLVTPHIDTIKRTAQNIIDEIDSQFKQVSNEKSSLATQQEELITELEEEQEVESADSPNETNDNLPSEGEAEGSINENDDIQKARKRVDKLFNILDALRKSGVDFNDFKAVIQSFQDNVDTTRVQNVYTSLRNLYNVVTNNNIQLTYEELMYDTAKVNKLVKENQEILTFSLESELYTPDHDKVSKNNLSLLNDLALQNNLDAYDSGFEFDSLNYRGEVGNNKVAYLGREYNRIFIQGKTESGNPFISVGKEDINNFLNVNLSEKVLDGTLKVGTKIRFIPLAEVELADGTILKAEDTTVENAPIGIALGEELLEGAYLHDVNWLNIENLDNTKENIEADQAKLRQIREYILSKGSEGVETEITNIGPGVPILDSTGELNPISTNLPKARYGVIKNGRVQLDVNNSVGVVNKILPREGTNVAIITLGNGQEAAVQLSRTKLTEEYKNSIISAITSYVTQERSNTTDTMKNEFGIDILSSKGIEDYLTKFLYGYNKSLPTMDDFIQNLNNIPDGVALTHFKTGEIRFGEGQEIYSGVITKQKGIAQGDLDTLLNNFKNHLDNLYINLDISKKGERFNLPVIDEEGNITNGYDSYNDFIKDNLLTRHLSIDLNNGKTIYTVQSSIEFNNNFINDRPTEVENISLTSSSFGNNDKYDFDSITEEINSPATDEENFNNISEVFNNSSLSDIGTIQEYNNYLSTIFPESKTRDILYHGSKAEFDTFKANDFSDYFFFSNSKELAETYGNKLYRVLINTTNDYQIEGQGSSYFKIPLDKNLLVKKVNSDINNLLKNKTFYKSQFFESPSDEEIDQYNKLFSTFKSAQEGLSLDSKYKLTIELLDNIKNLTGDPRGIKTSTASTDTIIDLLKNDIDSIVFNNIIDQGAGSNYDYSSNTIEMSNNVYTVFNPEQIYILGSKKDIEGFKEWKETETSDSPRTEQDIINNLKNVSTLIPNVSINNQINLAKSITTQVYQDLIDSSIYESNVTVDISREVELKLEGLRIAKGRWLASDRPEKENVANQIDSIIANKALLLKAVEIRFNKYANIKNIKAIDNANDDKNIDDTNDFDVEDINENEHNTYLDSALYTVDPRTTMRVEIQKLLNDVIDYQVTYENGEPIFKPRKNQFFDFVYPGEAIVYNKIMNILATSNSSYIYPTYDNYIEVLKTKVLDTPYLYDVVDKLENSPKNVQNAFVTAFSKHATQHIFLQQVYNYSNKSYDLTPVLSNSNSVPDLVISDWQNALRSKNILIKDGNNMVFNPEAIKDFNTIYNGIINGTVNLDYTNFNALMNRVGVEIPTALFAKWKNEGIERKDSKMSLLESFTFSGGIIKIINDRLKKLSTSKIAIGDNKEVDLDKINLYSDQAFKDLSRYVAEYRVDLTSNSHKDGNGNNIYSYANNKYIVDRFGELKTDEKLANDLRIDAFAKNSLWLTNMTNVNADGVTVLNKESLMYKNFQYFTLDSFNTGVKSKMIDQLTFGEFEKMKLSYFLNKGNKVGKNTPVMKFLYPTMSDKSTLFGLQATGYTFNLIDGKLSNPDLEFLLDALVIPEVNRIKQYQTNPDKVKILEYKLGGKNFLMFPLFNDLESLWIKDDEGNRELRDEVGVSQTSRNEMKALLRKYINNELSNKYNKWVEYGIITENEEGTPTLTYVDSSYVESNNGTDIDTLLRNYVLNYMIAMVNMQQLFIGDPALFTKKGADNFSIAYNTNDNQLKRLASNNAGKVAIIGEKEERFGLLVVQDRFVASDSIDYLKSLGEDIAKPYEKIDGTDAQEYTSLEEDLLIQLKEGIITEEQMEEIMNRHNTDKPLNLKEFNIILNPEKPVYSNNFMRDEMMSSLFVKSASLALTKELTDGTPLEKVRSFLDTAKTKDGLKVDRIAFASAVKVGQPTTIINIFNEDGSISFPENWEDSYISVLRQGHGIQNQVPYNPYSNTINYGSQRAKLLFNNLHNVKGFVNPFTNETVTGRELSEDYKNEWRKLYKLNYDSLVKELNYNSENGTIDIKALERIIADEAVSRNYNTNDLAALQLNSEGTDFLVPLWLNNNASKLNSLVNSIVDNRIRKIKVRGKSLVLVSEEGQTRFKTLEDTRNSKLIVSGKWDGNLKTTIEEDGSISYAEVLIPFKFWDNKGNLLNISDFIDEEGFIDNDKISPELLEIFGFRIPTQGLNSMSAIKIVGFTPADMGDIVIASRDFITQMGSDFDIDKLYTQMYNTYYNKGVLVPVTQEVLDEHPRLYKGEDMLIQNNILKYTKAVFSNPSKEVQKQRAKALGFDNLARLSKTLFVQPDNKYWNSLSEDFQTYRYQSARAGKALVGTFSLDSVFNATLQEVDAPMNFMTYQYDGDTKKLIPYRVTISGETSNNLNMNKAIDKEYKSDNIAEFQSAALDDAKEQLLYKLNINNTTVDAIRALNQLGFSLDVTLGLVNQPIIKQIIIKGEKDLNEEELTKPFSEEDRLLVGNTSLSDMHKYILDDIVETDYQYAIYRLFKDLTNKGVQLKNIQSIINTDSAGIGKNSFYSIEKAKAIVQLESKTTISNADKLIGDYNDFNNDSVYQEMSNEEKTKWLNEKLEDGYVRYKDILIKPTTINGFASVYANLFNVELWNNYFPYDRGQLSTVLNRIVENRGDTLSLNKKAEALQKAFSEYKSFLSASTYNLLGKYSSLQDAKNDLLVDTESHMSLGSIISDAKTKLPLNPFLDRLKIGDYNRPIDISGKVPTSISFINANTQELEEEVIIDSIIDLIVNPKSIGIYNGIEYDTKELIDRLIIQQGITSGVQKGTQLIKYLPFQYLLDIGYFGNIQDAFNIPQSVTEDNTINFYTQYIQHNPEEFYNQTIEDSVERVEDGRLFFKPGIDETNFPLNIVMPSANSVKGFDIYRVFNDGTYRQIDSLGNKSINEYDLSSQVGKSIIYANTAINDIFYDSFFPKEEQVEGLPNTPNKVREFFRLDRGSEGVKGWNQEATLVDKYSLNIQDTTNADKYKLILSEIIDASSDPILTYMARKLNNITDYLADVPIIVNENLTSKGRAFTSKATGRPVRIEINPKLTKSEDELQRVIVEETIHAILKQQLKSNSVHTKRLYALLEDAQKLAIDKYGEKAFNDMQEKVRQGKALKAGVERDILYNVSNIDEFVANAITNKNFQKFLNTSSNEQTSLWKRFIKRIKDILVSLGVVEDSNLEGVLHETIQLFEKVDSKLQREVTEPKYTRTLEYVDTQFGLKDSQDNLIPKENAREIASFIDKHISNIQATALTDNTVLTQYKVYNDLSVDDSINFEEEENPDFTIGSYRTYLDTINFRINTLKRNIAIAEANGDLSKAVELYEDLLVEKDKARNIADIKNLVELSYQGQQELSRIAEIFNRPMSEADILYIRSTTGFWKNAKEYTFDAKHYNSQNLGKIYGDLERQAQALHNKLIEVEKKYLEGYVKNKTGQEITVQDIFDNYKDVNTLRAFTQDISTYDNDLLSSIFIDVKEANIAAEDEGNEILKTVDELTNKILPTLKSINSSNPFDIFAQKDEKGRKNGHIVKPFNYSFFREKSQRLRALNEENNFKNFSSYVNWNAVHTIPLNLSELFSVTGELTSEMESKRNELKSQVGEYLYNEYIFNQQRKIDNYESARLGYIDYLLREYNLKNPEDINTTKKVSDIYSKWIYKNSPFKLSEYINKGKPSFLSTYKGFGSQNYYESLPTKTINGKDSGYYDAGFDIIQSNPDILEFYNLFRDTIYQLSKYLPHDQQQQLAYNGIPEIEKSVIEIFSESGMKAGYIGVRDALAKSVQSNYADFAIGAIDPITQKPLKNMRVGMIKNHYNEVQDYVNLKSSEYFIKNGEIPTHDLVEDWRLEKISELAEERSFDLPKILKVFTVGVLAHKHKSKIEDKIKIAKGVIDSMQEAELRSDGTPITIADTGRIYQKAAEDSFTNTKRALDHFINLNFYNDSKNEEGKGTKVYTKSEKIRIKEIDSLLGTLETNKDNIVEQEYITNKNILEAQKSDLGTTRVYSKYGDNVLKWFQLLGMGWNVLGGISNIGFGFISNVIEGAGGQLYTSSQLNEAYRLVSSSVLKNVTFNKVAVGDSTKIRSLMDKFNVLKDSSQELFKDTISATAWKNLDFAKPYNVNQRAEYVNQSPIMLAMMFNTKVNTPEGEINLYEGYDEEGKWKSEYGEEPKDIVKSFRVKLDQAIAKRIHGNYDPSSSPMIKRSFLGRATVQFRTWLIDAVAVRFGKEREDRILGVPVKGRYISAWDNKANPALYTELLKNIIRQGSFGTIFKNSDFNNLNLSEVDAANMRRVSMEVLLTINVQLLMLAMTSLFKGDDDEDNYVYNTLFNQGLRLRTDLMLYVNPAEGRKLFKDIIPAVSLLDSVKNWGIAVANATTGNDEYLTGEYAGDSKLARSSAKLVPFVSQGYKFYSSSVQTFD